MKKPKSGAPAARELSPDIIAAIGLALLLERHEQQGRYGTPLPVTAVLPRPLSHFDDDDVYEPLGR